MSGIHIQKSHVGLMAKDLGKKPGAPMTVSDIGKELRSGDPAKRSRGNFARMAARGWKPLKKKAS